MAITLTPTWTIGTLNLTSYPYGVDADSTVDVGEPEMVVESVTSQLADGDRERVIRHGNRTYSLQVYVEGDNLAELARAEANLRSAITAASVTLTHDPGDGLAPVSVYEVQTAKLTPARDDTYESHLIRKFTLTLTCSPWARSATPVTVDALVVPASETLVNIDTCDSATGWTGTYNGSPTAVSTTWAPGAVSMLDVLIPGGQTLTLTRTGSINFSSTRYLQADIGYRADFGVLPVTCTTNAGATLTVLEQRMVSPGRFIYTYDTGGVTVSSLTFTSVTDTDTADLKIYNLARTNLPPQITPRQKTRVVWIGGTERTPGSLHVASANGTDALDQTIVHTCPEVNSGYSPPLRRWRVSGNGTPTSTFDAMSGAYEPIHPNPFRAEVPNVALPSGGYILAARMSTDTAATHRIAWSTSTIAPFGGSNLVGGIEDIQFFAANQWSIVPLAFVTLPTIGTTGASIVTRVDIQRYSGTALINVDEVWLFRAEDDCALTIVGGVPAHLWLDSPGAGSPVPKVWLSATSDRSNMRHPGDTLLASGSHVFHPNGTAVFTAAVSDNPVVTGSAYPRWHSNAAS